MHPTGTNSPLDEDDREFIMNRRIFAIFISLCLIALFLLDTGKTISIQAHMAMEDNAVNFAATSIATGGWHTCALTTTGGVKCWGWNEYGQLGNSGTTNSSTPVDVIGLSSGVSAISAGSWHTCALTTIGSTKCWGQNLFGQLGNGGTTNSSTPVDVIGLGTGVSAISIGWQHNCVLTTAGGVKCWGNNNRGQLGNGNTTNSSTPVDVIGLSNGVRAISAGGVNTCALTTTGDSKCWGLNEHGQLGNGNTTNSSTPVDVIGLGTSVAAISTGGYYTCALTTSGGVKCWGYNYFGQLGNGGTTNSSTPVDVIGLSNGVSAISSGDRHHTCALTTTGGVKCWGGNSRGELGDGTITDHLMPVDVVGIDVATSTPTPLPTNTPIPTQTTTPVTFKVSGVVQNYLKGGIHGVEVKIGDQTTRTDIYGEFTIANLRNDTYNLSFTLSPYSFWNFPNSITIQGRDITVNAIGNYTAPNVDSGFRPSVNGFNFSNFNYYDETYTDASWDIFKRAFPDTLMENSDGSHKKAAENFYRNSYQGIGQKGNCHGFSQASIIWFAALRNQEVLERAILTPPNSTVTNIHNMIPRFAGDIFGNVNPGESDVKDYIHIYQGRQLSTQMKGPDHGSYESMAINLQGIKDGLASFSNSAFSINIRNPAKKQAHSLVAFRVKHVDSLDQVYVYDSNYPNDDNRYIEIDTRNNSWSYQLDIITKWNGNSSTFGLKYGRENFPASLPSSVSGAGMFVDSSQVAITILGDVESQFTDSAGNRLGIIDGQIIEDIPGTSIYIIPQYNPNEPTAANPIFYYIPATTTYTVSVNAVTTTTYTMTLYSNSNATSLQGVELDNNTNDLIEVGAEFRSLVLNANQNRKDFCYSYANDNLNDASRELFFCTVASPNSKAHLSVSMDSNEFTYLHSGTPTPYTFLIEQTGQSPGTQILTGEAFPNAPVIIRRGNEPNSDAPGGIGWEVSYFSYLPLVIR